MADRHDEDSRLVPYWRSLPSAGTTGRFGTGLGFEEAELERGLPRDSHLFAEAIEARKVRCGREDLSSYQAQAFKCERAWLLCCESHGLERSR